MVLKSAANDRRHLAFCHDGFRGPRTGLFRSVGISNNSKIMFDTSSFVNPTPLAHADTSRDVLPRGGTSQAVFGKSTRALTKREAHFQTEK
ncbi:hypothetical protein TNCV_5074681 [Trichonephila clavipes]|nr:hypothetical protein TNCV_5074681 [Trichonephila clavipes]